jgi:hypothetical protein
LAERSVRAGLQVKNAPILASRFVRRHLTLQNFWSSLFSCASIA